MINLLKSIYRKGFFHLLSSNLIVGFLSFGMIILVSKFLTPVEVGYIKLIQSYAAFFIIIGLSGYNLSTLKLCSEDRAKIEKIKIFALSTRKIVINSVLAALLMGVLSFFGLLSNDEIVSKWLVVYALVIPFAALGYNFISYFQALKKIQLMATLQASVRLCFIVIVCIATYFYGFVGLIYSTIFSYLVGTLAYLWSTGVEFIKFIGIKEKFPKFEHYALFTFLGGIVTIFGQYSDMYLIDYLEPNRELVGYYALATIFFLGATIVIGTVQSIVTPHFSEKEHDNEWQRRAWIKYQLLTVVVAVGVAIATYLLAYLVVEFYYGVDYHQVVEFTSVLMIKFFVWSTYAVTGSALVGLGKMKQGLYIVLFSAPISVLLGYLLYGNFGVLGVVYGQIFVNIFVMFVITIYMWRVINNASPA